MREPISTTPLVSDPTVKKVKREKAIQSRKIVVRKETFFQDAYLDARNIDSTIEAVGRCAFLEPVAYDIYMVEAGVGGGCIESAIEWCSC
jgi:hypothetical protein